MHKAKILQRNFEKGESWIKTCSFNTSLKEKPLKDITGKEVVYKLLILVFENRVDQLLGVPKLTSGSRENTTAAVYRSILEWDISLWVKYMCFDITASNTAVEIELANY